MSDIEERVKKIVVEHLGVEEAKIQIKQISWLFRSRTKNSHMLSDDTSSSVLAKLGNLESGSAVDRVNYAFKAFRGQLVLSTSFGIQSAVMLHLVSSQIPNIPVVFIDTGYLFPETYRFAQLLTERLELNLKIYRPLQTAAQQEAIYGKLWEAGLKGLEQYNKINKILYESNIKYINTKNI